MDRNEYNFDPMTGERINREQEVRTQEGAGESTGTSTYQAQETAQPQTTVGEGGSYWHRAEDLSAQASSAQPQQTAGMGSTWQATDSSVQPQQTAGMESTWQTTDSSAQASTAQAQTQATAGQENSAWRRPETGHEAAGHERNSWQPQYWTADEEEAPKSKKKAKSKAKKPWGFFRKAAAAVALAAVFGGAAGGTFYGVCSATGLLDKYEQAISAAKVSQEQTATPIKQVDIQDSDSIRLTNSSNVSLVTTDISDMVEDVIPAMVTIVNTSRERSYDFWGYSYQNQYGGSGIIVGENEEELLLVTNHHVAANSEKLEITFIDGTTAEAKVKGMNSDMDLAVLAISLEDLTEETKEKIAIAQIGDSDSLKLGEPAIVIGNALGIGISVTDGVISGLNREMTTEDGNTGTFIQTDAAINSGNSGGALLNAKGEVVGIVSNKIGGSNVDNMGYAIPITAAYPIINELMERQTRKEVVAEEERGWLGVSLQTFDDTARSYFNIPSGAYVCSVAEGSGAQKAGIYKGDVITKVENESVSSASDVKAILQYYKQGDTVTVTIKRLEAGEYVTHDLEVVLGASTSTDGKQR